MQESTLSGATADEMESFLKPLIARQADEIIIHIETKDLSRTSAGQVTDNILKLAAKIKKHGIKCLNIFNYYTKKVDICIKLICKNNITSNYLNNGGLYLNKRENEALASGLKPGSVV